MFLLGLRYFIRTTTLCVDLYELTLLYARATIDWEDCEGYPAVFQLYRQGGDVFVPTNAPLM
jgi:hypothetical protein